MDQKIKNKEVSGWYVREEQTPAEKAAHMREVERWYERQHRLNYRTVPVEIPGRMMLALGEMAMKRQISFSRFIEKICEDYLRDQKVNWRAKAKTGPQRPK